MAISTTSRMEPTFVGFIRSSKDALIIIQAVINSQLLAVPRRPHDREKSDLIKSGNVFVFIEEKSGIKRWTDGVSWSPSRIMGRFLVYRELDRQALNNVEGEKASKTSNDKKLLSKSKLRAYEANSNGLNYNDGSLSSRNNSTGSYNEGNNGFSNRALVGSLTASYAFKDYGLVKKTLSMTVQRNLNNDGIGSFNNSNNGGNTTTETYHLVSYYTKEDIEANKFQRPCDIPNLKDIIVTEEVINGAKENTLGGKISLDDDNLHDDFNQNGGVILSYSGSYNNTNYPPQHQSQFASPPLQRQQIIPNQASQYQQHLNPGFMFGPLGGGPSFPQFAHPSTQPVIHQPLLSPLQQQNQPPSLQNKQVHVSPPNNRAASFSSANGNGNLQPLHQEYFADYNNVVPFHQQHQLQQQQQQAQQQAQHQAQQQAQQQAQAQAQQQVQQQQQNARPQQYRFNSNQSYQSSPGSFTNASFSSTTQTSSQSTSSQFPPAVHQQNSSGSSFSNQRIPSPSSPPKATKGASPLTGTTTTYGSAPAINISSVTPRQDTTITAGNNPNFPIQNPATIANYNTGATNGVANATELVPNGAAFNNGNNGATNNNGNNGKFDAYSAVPNYNSYYGYQQYNQNA